MGRSPRIEYYGAIYKITRIGKWDIFKDDEDKSKLLEILEEVKERSDFLLLAYSILDNRYDLLIKFHNIPISKCMQKISMAYTKYYNFKYQRKGTPYKGRYKSYIIEDEKNLSSIIWEIHRIAIEKQLANSLEEYKWSSDFFYKFNLESVVDIGYILNDLDEDRNIAIKKYIEIMNNDDVIKHNNNKEDKRLDEILMHVCTNEFDFNLIKTGSRKAYLTQLKKKYILRCKELGFKPKDIGQNIGIGERAVRKYL